MKHTLFLLSLVFFLTTSCEDFLNDDNRKSPEVKIKWLNQNKIESENAIGDLINLELALEFSDMPDMYTVEFKVHFDHTLFSPDSFNYQIDSSFFATEGEVPLEIDVNQNGIYDQSDGDEYNDKNGNGQWDPPIQFPVGMVRLDTIYTGNMEDFEDSNNNGQYDFGEEFDDANGSLGWDDGLEVFYIGALGIPAPHNSIPSNVSGSAQVCRFYLSGVYTTTLFDVEIVEATEFMGVNIDPVELSVNSWDIYPHLVGNPHDPVLRMQQVDNSDENFIKLSINIEDSPNLSRLTKTIEYDPEVLSYNQYELLNYFDSDNYDFFPQSYDSDGLLVLEFRHKDAYQSSSADESSFSEGNGSILNLEFLLVDPNQSNTILTIPESLVSAESYNFSIGESYPLDINFWRIEESLEINF